MSTAGPAPPAAPGRGRAITFLLVVGVGVAFGRLGLGREEIAPDSIAHGGGAPDPTSTPSGVAPELAGVGRVVARPASGVIDDAARTVAAEALAIGPVAAGAVADFLALAPGTVEDRVSGGAYAPFPIPRSALVGNVGPFGVRDAAAASPPRWTGVARIESDGLARARPPTDVEASSVTALRGVVVGEDGRPVMGAEVIVYSSFYVRQARYDHRVQQIGRVHTDAEGVFDLRPIALDTVHFGADGEVLVLVRHPVLADLVAQRLPAVVPGDETDVGRLVLPERGARVHGIVRDLAGRPVSGAVVRVSGALDPTAYDKTERMIVLDRCPAAVTDDEGRYALADFAPGVHEISVHVRIDCVLHLSERFDGERAWSPRVRAGNAVRGRVVDPEGEPVPAAVVAGGGNWTPTNADGTFWLDNVEAGPLTLEVVHHDWRAESLPNVATNADEVTITLTRPLARVALTVVDAAGAPVPLVAIDWTWPPGGGPGPFATQSRYWHDARGVFAIVVPEGADGAVVSDARGGARVLAAEDLVDGGRRSVALAARAGGG